ncbi:hypothetical protein LZ023_35185 (plasmid) [Pseudomonas silvicola]|nr:hypothetical protein LZ023_35185 [Pseudomonas silvicola]
MSGWERCYSAHVATVHALSNEELNRKLSEVAAQHYDHTGATTLDLEADINDILAEDCARIHFDFHAAFERLNDPRNKPPISLHELDNVFQTFIQTHLSTIIDYDEGTRFVLKCNETHLHFPCAITHDRQVGK